LHSHSDRRLGSVCRTVLAALLTLPLAARATTLWAASATEKIRPSTAARPLVPPALTAAKNEFEAFQLAVVGPATNVSVTATALTGAGQPIPAPRLFREALLTLRQTSGPDGATGTFPDALVPDQDDVVGEKRNAFPFNVPAGETRAVWVELHVPAGAAAGSYAGSVVVHAAEGDVAVPVSLTVYDFALPSTASLESHFGLYYGDLEAAHGSAAAVPALHARYAQLGLDHRISVSNLDDGLSSQPDAFAASYGALVEGTAPTQLQGARLTSIAYLGGRNATAYRTWATYFKGKGWFDRLFDYTCDEPSWPRLNDGSSCRWDSNTDPTYAGVPTVSSRVATVKQGDPAFRVLVTANVQDAGALASTIDVLAPVLNDMDDKAGYDHAGVQASAYTSFLAKAGKDVWMYQSCMSHGCGFGSTDPYWNGWASYAVDASAMRNRAMEWSSFQWGATGELYYETTESYHNGSPWTNLEAYGGNGDGTLFYPGTPAQIGGATHIPVASIRLKMIREGMEDYEYLKLLSEAGDPDLAKVLAAQLFPNAWTQPAIADLYAARDRIARRIVELKAPPVVVSPPPGTTPPPASPPADPPPYAGTPGGDPPGGTSGAPLSGGVVQARLAGSGCSAGIATEAATSVSLLIAFALRRRRRTASAPARDDAQA
jgi:glycosyl hydrolase family 123